MKLLKKKNYLMMIENSTRGENWMFRNLYADVGGQEKDILSDGRWSCSVFVSSILYLQKLISDVHANVGSTKKDMINSGWFEIKDLRPGAVLFWEIKKGEDDGEMHGHNGFYVGGDKAISNDSKGTGFPHRHHYTYDGSRKIEKIYWHPSLDD